ncbi:hypothetical protein ACFVZD_44960 [Streptomyces sp. NPDC058287]|uniref:hypothetical protein n=1 Tax=unclassified Streptomyces TaxID=2593676 RepID=UPI0036EF8CA7
MKRGFLAMVGVLLSAVTGCTEASPPPDSPPTSSATASSASSRSPEPPETGPATPLGAATITAKDGKLVEAYSSETFVSAGVTVPATSEVAVLRRRRPAGTGDVAWMPDANTYCMVSVREDGWDHRCFDLAAKRKPHGYVHVGTSTPHGVGRSSHPHRMWLTVTIVENVSGRYAYTGGTPEHATPVQQATMKFPSGRTMTFVTYEFPERRPIPMDAQICNTGRSVCFKAFEPSTNGE